MAEEHKFNDDFAKMASSAMGFAVGMKKETEAFFRDQLASALRSMNVVSREEFEVVREMAVKAREEQEKLSTRIAALEGKLHKK